VGRILEIVDGILKGLDDGFDEGLWLGEIEGEGIESTKGIASTAKLSTKWPPKSFPPLPPLATVLRMPKVPLLDSPKEQ
jgi:hypothetical protein